MDPSKKMMLFQLQVVLTVEKKFNFPSTTY
jgi:hypothetical protein